MTITPGQQGVIRYVEETTAGTTPTNPDFLLFSPETTKISLMLDKDMKESLDIGEYDVHELFSARSVYGCSVGGHIYEVDKIFDFIERTSDGDTRFVTLEWIPNQDQASPTYIRGTGWRPKTVKLSSSVGEAWAFEITFEAGDWAAPTTSDPGIGTGSREAKAAITDSLRTFASGAITKDTAAWATLLGSFELTIEHDTEAGYTTGDADPVAGGASHGQRKITGTADISLDAGLETHWDEVVAFADHTIEIPFGTTGQPQIDLSGVKLPKIEAEQSPDTKIIRGAQPFQATGITETTVS